MTEAFRRFKENYDNLFVFYEEFATHYQNAKSMVELLLYFSNFIKTEFTEKFALAAMANPEAFKQIITKFDLKKVEGPQNILNLFKFTFDLLKFPEDQRIKFFEFVQEELQNVNSLEKMDFSALMYQLAAKFATTQETSPKLRSILKKKVLPTTKEENEQFFKETLTEYKQSLEAEEKSQLGKLKSLSLIQLWTYFEIYLKEVLSEIFLIDPIKYYPFLRSSEQRIDFWAHINSADSKEEIIENLIDDITSDYGKWYKARELLNRIWKINFFPKSIKPEIEKEISSYDSNLSLEQKLRKMHLFRNALIHNNGKIREIDKKRLKIDFPIPSEVLLDDLYMRKVFNLILGILECLDQEISKNCF